MWKRRIILFLPLLIVGMAIDGNVGTGASAIAQTDDMEPSPGAVVEPVTGPANASSLDPASASGQDQVQSAADGAESEGEQPLVVQLTSPTFSWHDVAEQLVALLGAVIVAFSAIFAVRLELKSEGRRQWRAKSGAALASSGRAAEVGTDTFLSQRLTHLEEAHLLESTAADADDAVKRVQLREWKTNWDRWRERIDNTATELSELAASTSKKKDADAAVGVREALLAFEGSCMFVVDAEFQYIKEKNEKNSARVAEAKAALEGARSSLATKRTQLEQRAKLA